MLYNGEQKGMKKNEDKTTSLTIFERPPRLMIGRVQNTVLVVRRMCHSIS